MMVEEYGLMLAVVGISTVVGFILGKLSTNAMNNKKIGQRITTSEIEQWRINPRYSTILEQKNPEIEAKSELAKLLKIKDENSSEVKRIRTDLAKFIKELSSIREEASLMKSPAEKAAQTEIAISMIMSSYSELRQDAEDCNAINVGHVHSKRFLKFIVNGSVKPGLTGQMKNTAVGVEIENPFKQNLSLIASQMEGMVSEHQEAFDSFFAFN
jgi:vacuolar-type H+-ATPase subunit I/STV1